MMNNGSRSEAIRAFDQARRQAKWNRITSRWQGRDNRVMPFEAIRGELRYQNHMYRGIREIALERIVGSVGRYHEFSRRFLPLNDSLRERWININELANTQGWPPIEVYKLGDAYFVKDGNHRVSVATQLNMATIEAHVWEFPADVSIKEDDTLDQVLINLGHKQFMEKTRLHELCPGHQLQFTAPGRYSELLAQIEDLRHTLTIIDEEEMPYTEAVVAWYEMIYLPTIQIIHESSLVADFPGRTEADLFVWLSIHRNRLREQYGDYQNLADLARVLAQEFKETNINKVARRVRQWLGHKTLPPLSGYHTPPMAGA